MYAPSKRIVSVRKNTATVIDQFGNDRRQFSAHRIITVKRSKVLTVQRSLGIFVYLLAELRENQQFAHYKNQKSRFYAFRITERGKVFEWRYRIRWSCWDDFQA